MIKRYNKSLAILIMCVFLLMAVTLTIAFTSIFSNIYKTRYFEVNSAAARSVNHELIEQLDTMTGKLNSTVWSDSDADINTVLSGADLVLFAESANNATIAMTADGKETELLLTQRFADMFLAETKDNQVYAYIGSLDDLTANGVTEGYIFVIKTASSAEGYILVGRKLSRVADDLPKLDLAGTVLTVSDSFVAYEMAYGDGVDGRLTYDFALKVSPQVKQNVKNNIEICEKVSYDGKSVILALANVNSAYGELRVGSYTLSDDYDAFIGRIILFQVIYSICGYILLGFGAYLIWRMYSSRGIIVANPADQKYFVTVDHKGQIIYANQMFKNSFDYQNIARCVQKEERLSFNKLLSSGRPISFEMKDVCGETRTITFTVYRNGNKYDLAGIDISKYLSELQMRKRHSMTDELTGLHLYKSFEERITRKIAENGGYHGAFAIIRLMNWIPLQIVLGVNSYNELIRGYAERVQSKFEKYGDVYCINEGDIMFVARDDEDLYLLGKELKHISAELNEPLLVKDVIIKPVCKVGFVVQNIDSVKLTVSNLVSNAYIALENAVKLERADFYVYYPVDYSTEKTDFKKAGTVQSMIERGEITVFFQPQYSLKEDRIIGYEALCRIKGDKSKEISVMDFIAVAEKYGGMIELGNLILHKTLDFARDIAGQGIEVSVNVSPIQLLQVGFAENFLKIFEKYNINPALFNVEITEGAAMYAFDEMVEKLNGIVKRGINVHIDDFGVAYSSVLYIKKLPVNTLKIDKLLIDDIVESEAARFLVKNVIRLVQDLGIKSIAEGVATNAQLEVLRELGCDIIQGYIISKALPRDEAIGFAEGYKYEHKEFDSNES